MSNYMYRAQRFARMVYPYIIKYRNEPSRVMRQIKVFNQRYHLHATVDYGISRIAIINSDYVIKIDYGTEGEIYGDCSVECRVYQQAIKDGFSYLLAEITPYPYNDIIFYIMPRIRNIGYAARYNEDNIYPFLTDDEGDWVATHLEDMHALNFGRKDNHPVIVDYALITEECFD